MNKKSVKELKNQLEKGLKELQDKLGINIKVGNALFGATSVVFKVECAEIDKDGKAMTCETEDFKKYASMCGLKADDLNRKFNYKGEKAQIIGFASRSRKYPILVKVGKKTYKMTANVVKTHLSLANYSLGVK